MSVAAQAMSLGRRMARGIDLQAFRLFVPVYLLVYGATLAILPVGPVSTQIDGRGAFGVATFISGLALLWLGAIHLARDRAAIAYGLLAVIQAGYGTILLASGGWVAGASLVIIAVGVLVLGPSRARVRPDPRHRADLLVLEGDPFELAGFTSRIRDVFQQGVRVGPLATG